MDVTRMSIARVLELGVPISWREAAAVVFEGASTAPDREGDAASRVAPATCLITRGGAVVVSDDASCRDPEAIAGLAADLLTACADRGDLGAALDAGRLLPFLEKLGQDTTWKRRRVQIAALALRALATEADRARADHGEVPNPGEGRVWPGGTTPASPDLGESASAPHGVRRFSRQAPRAGHTELAAPGGERPGLRQPRAATSPRTALVTRVIIGAAVAASATGAGFGFWQARRHAPPVSTGPSVESRLESEANRLTPVVLPVIVALPAGGTPAAPGVAEPANRTQILNAPLTEPAAGDNVGR
jgi:hypothetical protein